MSTPLFAAVKATTWMAMPAYGIRPSAEAFVSAYQSNLGEDTYDGDILFLYVEKQFVETPLKILASQDSSFTWNWEGENLHYSPDSEWNQEQEDSIIRPRTIQTPEGEKVVYRLELGWITDQYKFIK